MNHARRITHRRHASQDGWGLLVLLLGGALIASVCAGLMFLWGNG
jgi:hypothetical protein